MIMHRGGIQKSILFLFCAILLLQIDVCFSQNEVSGHVFSVKDSTAIYGGSVYFDGTAIGVSTNEAGYFIMEFEKNNSPLIISFMGYESVIINSRNIQISTTLPNIYLTEKSQVLETVYVETDTLSRSRKLELFKREFLGKNKAAELCDILNENSIKLRYIPSSKTLIASCNDPIIVENKYLGYILEYNLRDFQVKYNKRSLYFKFAPISIRYHGFSFFKPLEDKISRRILKNRKKSYLGSSLHFMRALYSKELDENKFKIFYKWNPVPTYKYFKITDFGKIKNVEVLVDKILIRYKTYEQSLLVPKGDFTIDYSGHHYPPESINLKGEMSRKRISELLPLGYRL